MSTGNTCGRCRAYLPDGKADGTLCDHCGRDEVRRELRDAFLNPIAANVARLSLEAASSVRRRLNP